MIDFFHKSTPFSKRASAAPRRYTHVAVYIEDGNVIGGTLLEVASTDEEKARGLMGREDMPVVCGMLFKDLSGGFFWMKNCLMPIDVMFIKDGKITKTYSMEPDDGQKRYRYDDEDSAIELKGGMLERIGITPGCEVRISKIKKEG
jgi:uncharacterized membrane protein (UPF0127 family)